MWTTFTTSFLVMGDAKMYTRVFLSAPPGARTQYQYKPTYVPNQPSASAFRPKQPEPKQPQQPSAAQKQQQQQQQQPKQKQNVSFKPDSSEYKPSATTTQRPSESFKPSPTAQGPTTGDYKASPKPERRHPAPEDSSTPPPQETPRRARSRPSFKARPRRWGGQASQQEEEKAQTPEPEEAKKEEEDKQDETDNVFTGRFRPRRKIQRRSSCFIKRYVKYVCFAVAKGPVIF